MQVRPFRFGVQSSLAADAGAWRALARKVESLGYTTMLMPDHFGEQFAPVPALMAAADATETLRIGALVWDNDYRHPIVFAKELATMDVLSGGRLQIGLGAGWLATDYEQSGIVYDAPRVRIDRFEEAVTVLKQALSGQPFSFTGTHYTVTDYTGSPRPVQTPHPPILIGGGGKRALTIAACEADIVGINPTMTEGRVGPGALASMTAEAVDAKLAIVQAAAGERLDQIELNVRAFIVRVTNERAKEMDQIAEFASVERSFVEESPFVLIGTPAQLAEDLLRRRERWGFSDIVVGAEDVESFAPVVAEVAGR